MIRPAANNDVKEMTEIISTSLGYNEVKEQLRFMKKL